MKKVSKKKKVRQKAMVKKLRTKDVDSRGEGEGVSLKAIAPRHDLLSSRSLPRSVVGTIKK